MLTEEQKLDLIQRYIEDPPIADYGGLMLELYLMEVPQSEIDEFLEDIRTGDY